MRDNQIARTKLGATRYQEQIGNISKEEAEETNTVKKEGLEEAMSSLEEISDSVLETLISNSLVESYGNVAGFRLAECVYADSQFAVNGTIYFTSGNTRKTAYIFKEAFTKENKISMYGINEKLGLDKQFTITGQVDDNKVLITESFTCTKK
jgi:hypothetical protein